MQGSLAALIAAAGLLFATVPARADFIATANLNGAQETTPGDTSTATGTLSLDYMAATQSLAYTLTFSGLTYPASMAHIHVGPPGVSGAILFTFFDYGTNPTPSTTGETVSGTLTAADFMPDTYDGINTFANAISFIEAGNTYVNVHSASPMGTMPNYMLGEIRGQILLANTGTVPEPGTLGLIGASVSLVAFGAFRRRGSR